MEIGVPVKRDTESINLNDFVKRSKLSRRELELGTGKYYMPIFSILIWSNCLVMAYRYNYLRSQSAFFFSIPFSLSLAKLCSLFLGDPMYRKATYLDRESISSAKHWEKYQKRTESS